MYTFAKQIYKHRILCIRLQSKLYIIYIMRLLNIVFKPLPRRSFKIKYKFIKNAQEKKFHRRFKFYPVKKNYFIFATRLATFATPLTRLVKFLMPRPRSLSAGAAISSVFTDEQQYGHFVANLLIDCWQYGHVRVVTGAFARAEFTIFTNINIANIVIKKLITVFKNVPRFNVVAPAAVAASIVA